MHGGGDLRKTITIILVIVIISLLSGGFYYYTLNIPSKEVVSIDDDMYLIVEDQIIEYGKPVKEFDDVLYFTYEFIEKYIDEDLFYDDKEKIVVFTNDTYVKRFKIDDRKGSINSKEFLIDAPIIEEAGSIYIPMNLFADDYEISINYYPDTNAVVMDYTNVEYLEGEVILEAPIIRSDLDIKAPIISSDLKIGDKVYVYGEFEKWFKVRTLDGIPGFIEKRYIKLNHTKDLYKSELKDRETIKNMKADKINLTWDYTYSRVKFTDNIEEIPGVKLLSPTWFSILDIDGNIQDKGNKDYVKKYCAMGYELWPLVDNSFDPDLTHELLETTSKREDIISKLLDIYLDYGFTGINLDFENVYYKDKDLLTQFVRELYPVFKEHGLIVSMDVTTISTSENWSMCYDRKRLHKSLDYIILMAYDQHWASSPTAGSVAEYSWVENGLSKVLEEIPSEKLILAVPFYTRLWTINEDSISSKSLSMEIANKFIVDNNIELIWLEDTYQYYGGFVKDNVEYKIWLEDEKSLDYKISLVHKYNLAGIASWRKGYETANIWNSIYKSLN